MCVLMTQEAAGIGCPVVRDGVRSIHGHHVPVKINQALATNGCTVATHAVCRMADRAGKPVVNMTRVFAEARIAQDLRKVVAFGADRIRPIDAQIRRREEIANQRSGRGSRADFVAPLQDMRPLGAMWPIRPCSPELPVVIAVVTITAEDLCPHGAAGRDSILLQHIQSQARLRQRAAARVHDRMAGSAGQRKLRYHVQKIAREHNARR